MNTKKAEIWLVTGISGCGWRELLSDVEKTAKNRWSSKKIYIYDVGSYMQSECKRLGISVTNEDILNVDGCLLETIRSLALKAVIHEINSHLEEDALFFVGIHAVFYWRNRLIPGVSYYDLGDPELNLSGVINVVDNLKTILERNDNNPVRKKAGSVSVIETQRWMQEEELLSKTIADIKHCPFYIIAKNHSTDNLIDFFKGTKKAIYLSYPITAIRENKPEALEDFQKEILPELRNLFVVFNPLDIGDLGDIKDKIKFQKHLKQIELENSAQGESESNNNLQSFQKHFEDIELQKISALLEVRTVQRDFRFINQSDAVVVYYNTDKNSPGVFAEIYYAFRTGKPVYVFYPYKVSPFLKDAVSSIDNEIKDFLDRLKEYSIKDSVNHLVTLDCVAVS